MENETRKDALTVGDAVVKY